MLDNAKIRTKVALVLLLPVLVILALAGVAVSGSVRSASSASSVQRLAEFGQTTAAVVADLQRERDAAAVFLGANNSGANKQAFNTQEKGTDGTLAAFSAARDGLGNIPTAVQSALDQLDEQLSQLPATRDDVLGRRIGIPENQLRYTDLISRLLTLGEDVASGSQNSALVLRVRALAAFSRVKEYASQELSLVDGFLRQGEFGAGQYRSFYSALSNQYAEYRQFITLATSAQRDVAAGTVTGKQIEEATRLENAVARSDQGDLNVDAAGWSTAMRAKVDKMRQAEVALSQDVVNLAVSASRDAVKNALIDSGAVLLALLLVLIVSALLARTIVRPLSRLRSEALSTAYERLPAAVRRLRDAEATRSGPDVTAELAAVEHASVQKRPDNELGQLGDAFDAMHNEAVRIALEQAGLRRQVSGMVVNLSRRSRAMVNRLIAQVDKLEATEADPDRLADLFLLDHLATRMRRNDDSLLVLAGARPNRQRGKPASLLDVVRAAMSEVEQYTRVDASAIPAGVHVIGDATDDLAHLLAELMENATQFSAPSTSVTITARQIHDDLILEIDDRGIGIPPEELDELNERLSTAASVEVAADRRLGLFVVGRLAARHGAVAVLRRMPEGTRAEVRLPARILLTQEQLAPEPQPRQPEVEQVVAHQLLVSRPLRASRMQHWQWAEPSFAGDGAGSAPVPPQPLAAQQSTWNGYDEDYPVNDGLPKRTPGALLFPGNMGPANDIPPAAEHPDRPQEVRRSLSALRRGTINGRTSNPPVNGTRVPDQEVNS